MNCAHHADQPAVAYCRTCGKALCANCTRPVRGVIYCEDCLGARMEGSRVASSTPAAGFVSGSPGAWAAGPVPPAPPPIPVAAGSGPNPTVAGILAGFFPFGVGPVYTGQYAKGLAYLGIFGLLIAGISASDHGGGEVLGPICGFGLAFFWVYQIIDSVRSARAIQAGLPAPDPYGLAATFGAGTKVETNKIPIGAIVLILLGILFLLSTMGIEIGLDRFWPLILIGVGGWLFARNWGPRNASVLKEKLSSRGVPTAMQDALAAVATCQCTRCRARRLMGPAVLVTIGFLFLFETLGRVGFHRTWPILLLVIGGVKLFQGSASTEGHVVVPPQTTPVSPAEVIPPPPPAPPVPPSSPSEVNRG
jgi:TM2 domain-containing membrane protein YozV